MQINDRVGGETQSGHFGVTNAAGDYAVIGLGDRISAVLDSVGITKERVQAVASTVGIKDCGCGERQRIANEIGAKYLGIGRNSS